MKRLLRYSAGRSLQSCILRRPNLLIIRCRFLHIAKPRKPAFVKRQPLFLPYSYHNQKWCRGQFLLARAFSQNPEKDYYNILGLAEDASLAQVKAAYYKLAKKWHPDLYQQAAENELNEARAKFREIQEAHEVLSDNDKKYQYDMQRKYGTTGQSPFNSGNQGFGSQGQGQQDFWKQQQEMNERMEEMKRKNPEMWKQHEQVREFMNRLWRGLIFLIALQLVFAILFTNPADGNQQNQQNKQDRREEQSGSDLYGDSSADREFQKQEESWMTSPSFGSTNYPKQVYILGDELPSMYLNPSSETLDQRPTYRSSRPIAGTGMYFVLYHGDGEWRISLSQYINHASKCYARVEDSAYNPAEISGTWRVFDRKYNRYEYDSNFRLSTSPNGDSVWI